MPLYTYRCENCGVQFDEQQHFSDPPLTVCPECGEETLRKLYQPVGILFKGSGFYSTDHRSPSGQSTAKKAEKSEAPAAAKESTSSKPSSTTEE
jgi:putative FmdB family regulatory protein